MTIAENLKAVQDRIAAAAKRAGRDPASVKLLVVTKTVDPARIREAVKAGAAILGENRVQEARDKIAQLGGLATWHLIGSLQKNKAKYAVKLFDLIHSVDSLELAQEIDQQAARAGKIQRVLIEVNIAGEDAKAGINVGTAVDLAREAAKLRNIRIQGLMTMPPYSEDPENSRPYFQRLRELAGVIIKENISGLSLQELSMGMSGDFEVAVEEGATMVRVGTAIFGSR
ncbi:MAG: YggS family pyridoxal phosphate enzyme [Nitrospirae bacterium GWC2_57_13]|jgi:PLP dependent protein|nr:MAG: YggS family pyridoxal phosphate enzyme [Nitrospirae bacterium GWC2_57_13]OGW45828.1 MAG: YggS family pyridoxal phosphate enzyme [Nitrospirae bacterium GWD2_57_8]HAS52838.1 YggS family pyridoxal phosphate-dependent enzyme [Nitrospiraceae bacterium]